MTSIKPVGPFSATCPTRALLDQLADKWSVLILLAVKDGPVRFNALQRTVEGITQKMLGQTLRRLERNGLVTRRVLSAKPIAVEYGISSVGQSLAPIVEELRQWSITHIKAVSSAQEKFDRSLGPQAAPATRTLHVIR